MDRVSQYEDIEMGNLLFGNSRGEYRFPDRDIVYSEEWVALRAVLGIDSHGFTEEDNQYTNARGGYDDGVICVNPYYWGEDDAEAEKPNFLDREIGLEIRWYKYPFRDSYMNWNMDAPAVKNYFGSLALRYMAKRYEGANAWNSEK